MRHRLASLLVAIGAAGCLTASGSTAPVHVPPPRPLDGAVMFTAAETRLLHDASELLVQKCMAAHGLTYQPVPAVDHEKSSAANPYGLLDRDAVRTDGYGMTSEFLGAAQAQPADPNEAALASMTEAGRQSWRAALTGSDDTRRFLDAPDGTTLSYQTDGCVARAGTELYGAGWEPLFLTFQGYANLVLSRTEQDTVYRRAVGDWARCMSGAGYRYGSLQDPRREIKQRLGEAPPPAGSELSPALRQTALAELAVARADADCEFDTGLNEAVATAQRTAETATLTPEVRADLDRLRTMRQAALDRAQRLVS